MSFLADTTVVAAGFGCFDTHLRPGWDIGGNANGGYMLAIVARAIALHCERPDPITITAHYLNPGKVGPAQVRCETVKSGKRFATVQAQLRAGDRPLLQVLATSGDLSEVPDSPEMIDGEPPQLPEPQACRPSDSEEGIAPPFLGKVDLRLHPDDAGFRRGEPSGEACIRGWFRLQETEEVSPWAMLLGLDAFPPTIFNARLPMGWAPTVELTCHIRGRPAPGWLRARFTTRFVSGGFLEEDGELWDSQGRLVAQSRQLGLVPRPLA